MSSCTFSFRENRRYVLGLLAFALLPAFGLFALGVALEPLYGDLTRIGFYAEREFGWSKRQFKFSKPLYTKDQYDQYHDFVVIGDSFSRVWPLHQWQNYVSVATDWSVVTLEINPGKLERVLESRVFRETPPKILVLESVERYLPERINDAKSCDASKLSTSKHEGIFIKPQIVRVDKFETMGQYVKRVNDWGDVKLQFVANYIWNGIWRTLTDIEMTEVRKVGVMGSTLFSSANKREMLIYKDDFLKVSQWQQMGFQDMGCRIERIRRLVEANGRTRFVLMVAPDKLTAYSRFLDDNNLRTMSMLAGLSEHHPDVIPRLDLALTSAIQAGELDVYLPDDTHWGSSGHRITAETLLGFLGVRE